MRIDKLKIDLDETNKYFSSKITENTTLLESMSSHSKRIKDAEENLSHLEQEMARHHEEGAIDFEKICSRDEYEGVLA